MLSVLQSVYSKMSSQEEGFSHDTFPILLALITVVLLQLLLGKYLWNNYLVRIIPAISPVAGIVDILAVSFLVRLLFC
jgi:hypothetical protein